MTDIFFGDTTPSAFINAYDRGEIIGAIIDDDRTRLQRHTANEHDSLSASILPISDPAWQIKDRSVAGLRISAAGGIG